MTKLACASMVWHIIRVVCKHMDHVNTLTAACDYCMHEVRLWSKTPKATKVRNCGHVHRSSVSGHLHRCRAVARVQTAAPNTLKRASVSTVGQIGCLVQQVRVYTARALGLSPAAPTFCVYHLSPNVAIDSLARWLGAAGELVCRARPWHRVWLTNRPEASNKCSGTPTLPCRGQLASEKASRGWATARWSRRAMTARQGKSAAGPAREPPLSGS